MTPLGWDRSSVARATPAGAAALALVVLILGVGGGRAAGPAGRSEAAPVVAAAGDIACDPGSSAFRGGRGTATNCHERATSNLLVGAHLAAVLTLGDTQYEDNAYAKYLRSFDPTWGRVKPLIRPALGNHEYLTAHAAGYFRYFGAAAGPRGTGYYGYDIGAWHLIALNSNCPEVGGCDTGSRQERWLRHDLARHRNLCTLAYWHHPRFSSGQHGNDPRTAAFWRDLYAAGAEIVLNGHDHDYERFAPQTPNAVADPTTGIREFVVGTGGKNHYRLFATQPNSQVRNADTYGVLELTLRPTGYRWRFVPETGGRFHDAGTGTCHGPRRR